MNRRTRIFISYKTGTDDALTFQANAIRQKLEDNNFGVWMDQAGLIAGRDWNTQIYTAIPNSDILLLLLSEESANSDWVRREVDVAKGARVTILPVRIRGNFDQTEVLERFDLGKIQYLQLTNGDEEEYNRLIKGIREIEDETLEAQTKWLEERKYGELKRPYHPTNPSVWSTTYRGRNFHLAGGSLVALKNIDVLVNSENSFLQMARFFESKTVSSSLRYYGSDLDDARRIRRDTIQDELNAICKDSRPVGIGSVYVTSAGGAKAPLRNNGARYIIHTVTISVSGTDMDRWLEPVRTESGLAELVHLTLGKVSQIDAARGVVSPDSTPEHREQKANESEYSPIRSIVLPAFGTGHGGRPLEEVAPPMIRAVQEFMIDHEDTKDLQLEHIHLCLFSKEELDVVIPIARDIFSSEGSVE